MHLHILPAATGRHRITTTEAAELRRTAREATVEHGRVLDLLRAERKAHAATRRQLAASDHARHDAQAAIATQARIIHCRDQRHEDQQRQLATAKDTIAALRKRLDEAEALLMERSGAADTQPVPVLTGSVLATPPKPSKPPVALATVPTGLPMVAAPTTPVDMPGHTTSVPVSLIKQVAA